MKIFIVGTVSSSIFGFRKHFLQELVSRGHEVFIYTTDLTPDLEARARREIGVFARRYEMKRTGVNPFDDIKAFIFLVREMRALGPDMVFCYFAKPVIWGALAALFAGVRKRYGMLEGLGYYFTDYPGGMGVKKKIIKLVQVFLFHISIPFLNRLIVLNEDDKKDIQNKYRIKCKDVSVLGGIGVDLNEYPFSHPVNSPVHFIFIGRLLVEKGINEFLDAAEHISQIGGNVRFSVFGEVDPCNPGSVNLDRLKVLQEKGVINYPGAVNDIPKRLAQSSVFVLPSYREGMPRSTQEAMSSGRAIITTDVPGCRDSIDNEVNGFIIPPRDSSSLIKVMREFVSNPCLVTKMGKESRRLAEEKYDKDIVNRKLFSLIGIV